MKTIRGKKKKRKEKLLSHSAQGYFLIQNIQYLCSSSLKNPMIEFFTLLTKLIKYSKKKLSRFIIKATLWLNQLNLKHAASHQPHLTLTVKCSLIFHAVCCSFVSKPVKVRSFCFPFLFCACVCVTLCVLGWKARVGAAHLGGHAQTKYSPFVEWLIIRISSLSSRSAAAFEHFRGSENTRGTQSSWPRKITVSSKFWLCFYFHSFFLYKWLGSLTRQLGWKLNGTTNIPTWHIALKRNTFCLLPQGEVHLALILIIPTLETELISISVWLPLLMSWKRNNVEIILIVLSHLRLSYLCAGQYTHVE